MCFFVSWFPPCCFRKQAPPGLTYFFSGQFWLPTAQLRALLG